MVYRLQWLRSPRETHLSEPKSATYAPIVKLVDSMRPREPRRRKPSSRAASARARRREESAGKSGGIAEASPTPHPNPPHSTPQRHCSSVSKRNTGGYAHVCPRRFRGSRLFTAPDRAGISQTRMQESTIVRMPQKTGIDVLAQPAYLTL